jgi:hypothetical protein
MTYRRDSGRAPSDHFAAGLEEYEGRTPEDAATTEIAVRNAVRTIEGLMQEDRRRRARDGLPDLALPDELGAAQGGRGRGARRSTGAARGAAAGRPVVYGAWAAAFAAVLFWPQLVLVTLFVLFVACLVGVALFGPEILERLRERVMRLVVARDAPRAARRAAEADEDDMPDARKGRYERLHDLRG